MSAAEHFALYFFESGPSLSDPFITLHLRATFFAAMDPDGMHLGNPKTGKIFIKNFFADFKAVLGRGHVVKDYKKCDFEPMRRHLNEQKMIRKAITDEERKANKEDRNQALYKYGFAIVDGHLEKVGNYNMVRMTLLNQQFGQLFHFLTFHSLLCFHRNHRVPFEDVESIPRWESSSSECFPNKFR